MFSELLSFEVASLWRIETHCKYIKDKLSTPKIGFRSVFGIVYSTHVPNYIFLLFCIFPCSFAPRKLSILFLDSLQTLLWQKLCGSSFHNMSAQLA